MRRRRSIHDNDNKKNEAEERREPTADSRQPATGRGYEFLYSSFYKNSSLSFFLISLFLSIARCLLPSVSFVSTLHNLLMFFLLL